jgi:Na+-transporting methylmalonyl-CoA/oxaloacetate decarboxylase gamma subunit
MKKLIILIVLITPFVWAVGQAITGEKEKAVTPQQKAKLTADRMVTDLNLDQEQSKQVYAIQLQYFEERKALQDKRKLERKRKIETHKRLRTERELRLERVLNSDQQAKLSAIISEKQELEITHKQRLKARKLND